jgi:hypothetical protein
MSNNLVFDLNLDELFVQLSQLTDTPTTSQQAYLFLLHLWGYFEVSMQEVQENNNSEAGSNPIATPSTPNLIQIENAYIVHDYGSYLRTSAGEYYASYATGRLLNTVKAMLHLLIQRGAKQLQFDGLAAAKHMAWIECEKYQIKVSNFKADNKTQLLQNRLSRLDSLRDSVYSYSSKK